MITLHPNEEIKLVVHKHWFVFAGPVVLFALVGLMPLVLGSAFLTALHQILPASFSTAIPALAAFLYFLWLLFLWLMLALEWTDYYLDVWYLTDERLIDVEQKWIFRRDEAELRLNIIQDVTVRSNGWLPTLLGFGDILVQTAGEKREFFMKNAARPQQLRDAISHLQDALMERPQAVKIVSSEV